jgi:hypothetical protein
MVRQKSQSAQELDALVAEAVLGVQSGKYKSSYAAAKALELSKDRCSSQSAEWQAYVYSSASTTTTPYRNTRKNAPKVD